MNVRIAPDGRYEVVDRSGHVVAGPFDTNAEAWRAADRIGLEPRSGKRSDFVTSETFSVGRPTPKKQGKKARKQKRKMMRAAAKAPNWLRTGAAATFDPHGNREHRDRKLGTFGAASEVRHIDPATYEAAK